MRYSVHNDFGFDDNNVKCVFFKYVFLGIPFTGNVVFLQGFQNVICEALLATPQFIF